MSGKEKLNWYQTDSHVVLTILIKEVHADQLKVDIQPTSLSVEIKQPAPLSTDYKLQLGLAHSIVVDQCSTKLSPSKVEIKLKKTEGIRWAELEGDGKTPEAKQHMAQFDETVHKYPSSAKHTHNWDKVAADAEKEEKEEKLEGDAALNKLFQQIYADASDETKRAMLKSFSESGGTVLSTNWNEVGKGTVDVKPPDGMEYKKWEM